jgi:hypothetical protein
MLAVGEGFACPSWSAAEREVDKITPDRLLIETQPLVKASELVGSQSCRRPLWLGRDSGDVAARVGGLSVDRQARAPTPERTLPVIWPATGRCQVPERRVYNGEGPPGMRLAKWPGFWRGQAWPGLSPAEIRSEKGG